MFFHGIAGVINLFIYLSVLVGISLVYLYNLEGFARVLRWGVQEMQRNNEFGPDKLTASFLNDIYLNQVLPFLASTSIIIIYTIILTILIKFYLILPPPIKVERIKNKRPHIIKAEYK